MRTLSIKVDSSPVDYSFALERQQSYVQAILENSDAPYVLNFLEHTPVLTTGRTYDPSHLLLSEEILEKKGVPIVEVSRGGSVTYHGPGQLTVYVHVHLKELELGLTSLMRDLEQWVIDALRKFDLLSGREEGKTGVWTDRGKVCAMGIAAKKFVTYHGIGLNVNVDPKAFEWIVPCGLTEPVASLDHILTPAPNRESVIHALMENLPPWLQGLETTYG